MTDQNPSILSHVSLGSNRFDEAAAFYDQTLSTLGCKRIMAHPGAIAWGREYPEFWLQTPIDGQPASIGNGTHWVLRGGQGVGRCVSSCCAGRGRHG